jgi:hypothetical protein
MSENIQGNNEEIPSTILLLKSNLTNIATFNRYFTQEQERYAQYISQRIGFNFHQQKWKKMLRKFCLYLYPNGHQFYTRKELTRVSLPIISDEIQPFEKHFPESFQTKLREFALKISVA